MESLSELYEALSQVSNSDQVQLQPYQLDIYDVACGATSQTRPLFAMCLPLTVAAISGLFKDIPANATLAIRLTTAATSYSTITNVSKGGYNSGKFIIEIGYYGNLQHRITGTVINNRLDGQYRIESFSATTTNDYQLVMTFVNGLADNDSVVRIQDELQQITYNKGSLVSKLTYQLNVDDPSGVDIFTAELYRLPLTPITMEEYRGSSKSGMTSLSLLFAANGGLLKRTLHEYNSNGDVITNSFNSNEQQLSSSITNICGKVVRDERYDPNKSYGNRPSGNVINTILSRLSYSETFTGLLPVIYKMLSSMKSTSVSDKVVVDHSTVSIGYGNVIHITAYTIRGYKSYTFDQDGQSL